MNGTEVILQHTKKLNVCCQVNKGQPQLNNGWSFPSLIVYLGMRACYQLASLATRQVFYFLKNKLANLSGKEFKIKVFALT